MSSKGSFTLRDFVALQRGTTYKGNLLGLPGPVLLGLASIASDGGFRRGSFKTYGGASPAKITLGPGDLYVSLKDVTQSGDLLGSVARVPTDIQAGRLTQDTVKLDFQGKPISRDYVYWLLRTSVYREYCRARGTGTTTLGLSRDDFLNFPVVLPNEADLSLVELLEGLDNRIALLRETNCTLEVVAQALFKSWFVDFDPVRAKLEGRVPEGMDEAMAALFPNGFEESELGLVPTGWRVGTIGEHTSYLNRGISPKYIEDGGIVVINQKCIRDFSLDMYKARRHDPAQRKIDGRELLKGDILVNSTGVGTLGRVAQVLSLECPAIVDSHVTVMRAGPALTWNYLGLSIMRRQPEIESMGEGSTGQTELSRGKLAALKLLVPSAAVLTEFDKIALPLRERFSENQSQAKTLASLRDALLPRLISGQLQTPSNSNEEEEAQIG
jgi:type I restriction enzyme S subunit